MEGQTTMCQYDVDGQCRVYLADGTRQFSNMYGAGIGYPQRRSDGIVLPKSQIKHHITFYKYPKVDSFDMYRSNVGTSISRNIWEEQEKIKKEKTQSSPIVSVGSFTITNAQNRIYHIENNKFKQEDNLGAQVLDFFSTHKAVEYFSLVCNSTHSMFYGDEL